MYADSNQTNNVRKINLFPGYKKIVVSSKPTASSFSFGQKHKHIGRNDTVGPGPAIYDVTGLGNRGWLVSHHPFEIMTAQQSDNKAPAAENTKLLTTSKNNKYISLTHLSII